MNGAAGLQWRAEMTSPTQFLDLGDEHLLSAVLDQMEDAPTLLRSEAACRLLRVVGRDAFSRRAGGRWFQSSLRS